MENVRKHKDIQIITSIRRAKMMVSQPTFQAFSIFSKDLVGVQRLKKSICLNRPIYVGFAILELSKLHMYKFHYEHIKAQYAERAQLLFTDTDSLTYHITTEDVYSDMKMHQHIYDTSDYPKDHPLYSEVNKKKIGLFKDELNSNPIYEFIGLRSKMYSILSSEGEKKTAKGVCRRVVKKKIRHQQYKDCLLNLCSTYEKQNRILSEKHQLYTTRLNKVALSPFDDKRYILEDGVHTLAYGHFEIQ